MMIRFIPLLFISFTASARLIGIPALSCIGEQPVTYVLDDFEASQLRNLVRESVPSRISNPDVIKLTLHFLEKLSWDFPRLSEAMLENLKKLKIQNRASIQASAQHLDALIKPAECDLFAISAVDLRGPNSIWIRTRAERLQTGLMDQTSILIQVLTLTILQDKTSLGTRVFTGYLLSTNWNFLSLNEKKIIMRQVGFKPNWLAPK